MSCSSDRRATPNVVEDENTHLCAPYSCSRRMTSAEEIWTGARPSPEALPVDFFDGVIVAIVSGFCEIAEGAMAKQGCELEVVEVASSSTWWSKVKSSSDVRDPPSIPILSHIWAPNARGSRILTPSTKAALMQFLALRSTIFPPLSDLLHHG